MRMGAFMLGGLVGAGMVMLWNRKGREMSFSVMSHRASRMMNKAMNKGEHAMKSASRAAEHFDADDGLHAVREMVDNGSEELKEQVNEILHHHDVESSRKTHALTQ